MSNPTFTEANFDHLARLVAGYNIEDHDQRWLRACARNAGMSFKNTKENTNAIVQGLLAAKTRAKRPVMTGDLSIVSSPVVEHREFSRATVQFPGGASRTFDLKNPEDRGMFAKVTNFIGVVANGLKPKRTLSCPPSPLPVIERPTLPSDFAFPIAVLSDLHVPMHDAEFIDRMVDFCVSRGVKSFILAGDVTDNNQWNKRTNDIRTERRWQDDIELARTVVAYIATHLGPGYIFFGNHDEWIMKATRGQMDTNWLYQHLFPDVPVQFSFKHQVYIPARGGVTPGWLVVHGERYSHGNPMGVVEKYALHAESNVIMGHQHYAAQWKSGSYHLIMNGGLMSYERMDYMVERPQPMRQQQRGFTIIDERGDATLYTEYQTWR